MLPRALRRHTGWLHERGFVRRGLGRRCATREAAIIQAGAQLPRGRLAASS